MKAAVSILLAALVGSFAMVFVWPAHDEIWQRKQEMLDVVVKVDVADGSGSGTVIHSGEDGVFILTNHHVLPDKGIPDQNITVLSWVYPDANSPAMPLSQEAVVVADDEKADLALLKVKDPEWRTHYVAAVLGTKDHIQPTEPVYAVGSALGERTFVTEGMISLTYSKVEEGGPNLVMISAPIIWGNSGGAAFVKRNGHYVFIGVPERGHVAKGLFVAHMGYAIAMSSIREFLAAHDFGDILKRPRAA